ncbi:MAG: RHS repeat-associated core domain-containing protein, partial [Alphaproteobacteria bacterium]
MAVHKEYIWFQDRPIALFEDSVTAPEAIRYVHTDHLGAPEKATDGAQAVVWDLTAGPFGELEQVTGALANNLRFPGQYRDAETADAVTAYRYNLLRDYDPSLGRYLQSDPIGLMG